MKTLLYTFHTDQGQRSGGKKDAGMKEGLKYLEHAEKEYMAQNVRATYLKTRSPGRMIKTRDGEKADKSERKTQGKFINSTYIQD